jgi:hypothetical protein
MLLKSIFMQHNDKLYATHTPFLLYIQQTFEVFQRFCQWSTGILLIVQKNRVS